MKRLLCAYRNASLRVKLSLLVTAVLLTVLIACQVALYFYVAENVERQARSAADVTLTQAQTYMDAKLRNVVERLFYIRLDPSFEGALTDYLLSDKPSAQGVAMTLLSPCLSLHKVTEPLISSIFLYTPKSSFTDMGVSTEQEYRFEASVLWRQAEESESYVIWGEVQKDEIFITHREVLPVMYRFSVDGYGGDCVLLANIDKARLTILYPTTVRICCWWTAGAGWLRRREARLPPRLRKTTGRCMRCLKPKVLQKPQRKGGSI